MLLSVGRFKKSLHTVHEIDAKAAAGSFYYELGGAAQKTPVKIAALATLILGGDVVGSSKIWTKGMLKWSSLVSQC